MEDLINHPSHYTDGKYEVLDVIDDWWFDYRTGNALKYISRSGKKAGAAPTIGSTGGFSNPPIRSSASSTCSTPSFTSNAPLNVHVLLLDTGRADYLLKEGQEA